MRDVLPWLDMHAQQLLTEVPRSCLLRQWAKESLVLVQYYCRNWLRAARVVPCASSEKHLGATCQDSGFRGLVHWIDVTAVLEVSS